MQAGDDPAVGQRELVDAQRPEQGVGAQAIDRLAASADDAGLRTSQELVAAEADEVGAGLVNIIVGFAPLKPAEFVYLELRQKTAEAV